MGFIDNLQSIFRGTTANDKTGTPARDAGAIVNGNFTKVNNALEQIDANSLKTANRATTLDAPNDTNVPTTKAVSDAIGGIGANANAYTDAQLVNYQPKSEKGVAGGYPGLDSTNKINPIHLPAGVDEVVEASSFANLPNPGAPATIYITTDNNKTYRWGGTVYAEIQAAPGTTDEVVEGEVNQYFTAARVRAVLLTGIDTVVGGVITAGDTVLQAFGKLQAQITGLGNSLTGKLDKGGYSGTAKDLETLANSKETTTGAQSKADSALQLAKDYYDGLTEEVVDKRLSNIASDLSEAEKTAIKNKLGVTEGGATSIPDPLIITQNHVLTAANNNQLISAENYASIVVPSGLGLKYRVTISKDTAMTVSLTAGENVVFQFNTNQLAEIAQLFDGITLAPKKIVEGVEYWGLFGALKAANTNFATYDGAKLILTTQETSAASLYWTQVHKSSDWDMLTTTKDYWVLYGTVHDPVDGGIWWGECDDPEFGGFIERGLVVSGHQAETPFPIKGGDPSNPFYLYYHTFDEPGHNTGDGSTYIQETRLIKTSGGELHTATWIDMGRPVGLLSTENHTGYIRVFGEAATLLVAHHNTKNTIDEYAVSHSTDGGETFTRQFIIDKTANMPSGGRFSFVASQVFERNGKTYGFIAYTDSLNEKYIAVAELDSNFLPSVFVKTIYKFDISDIKVYILNEIAYLNIKTPAEIGEPYYQFKYNLKDLD